jgi:PPOX class probable F420-dependent enzyme
VPGIDDVRTLATSAGNLAVLAVARPDGSVQASVVSVGVHDDPVDGTPSIGVVAMGGAAKLRLLRTNPQATVIVREGTQWCAVAGRIRLVGPDDPADGVDVAELLRSVYRAAGGTHGDWDEYDRVMAADRRCAVFVHAERVWSNG